MAAAPRSLARPGATIRYWRRGMSTGPPLVLLHATLSSSAQLGPLADRLASRAEVFTIDRRASGESVLSPGTPAAPIDVAVHVADLDAVMTAEGMAPAVLVGHSYGGCLALELAARRPALVRGVWAWEPPYAPVAPDEVRRRITRLAADTLAAADRDGTGVAAEVFLAGVAGPPALDSLPQVSRERIRASGAAAVAEAPLLGLDADGLAGIRCPVMIASGEASSGWYGGVADTLAAGIPGAQRLRLAGAEHLAPILDPDIIAADVATFLDR